MTRRIKSAAELRQDELDAEANVIRHDGPDPDWLASTTKVPMHYCASDRSRRSPCGQTFYRPAGIATSDRERVTCTACRESFARKRAS